MVGLSRRLKSKTALTLLFCTNVSSFTTLPQHHRAMTSTSHFVSELRDADFAEMMVGGERYEMVPLPDSMIDTTLFVGNLNEFVKDGDLSLLFSSVSSLQSLPACVARKPNMNSLHYGFVTFPNAEEKERAIIKFHGLDFMTQKMKVEPIRDVPGRNRVRVPEKLVAYMCGAPKKTRGKEVNTLRRVSRVQVKSMSKNQGGNNKKKAKKKNNDDGQQAKKVRRISKAQVDRMSRGQDNGKKGRKNGNKAPDVPMRLSDKEQAEFGRSARKGFVSLLSTAYRQGRKSSALANVHREWCDAREKPQIVLCKASGGRPLDHVIVDLSPLRVYGLLHTPSEAEEFMTTTYKSQILLAAKEAGMELRKDYVEDNTISDHDEDAAELVIAMDSNAWATQPLWSLPAVSLGVFEGERSKAKAMAKELAELWDIPEQPVQQDRTKRKKGRGSHGSRRDRNPYNLLK